MIKYYAIHISGEGMFIKKLSETAQNNRCWYEKKNNTYNSLTIYNSIEDTIKDLGTYSKPTILPDGSEVIPYYYNYNIEKPILKKIRFPVIETVC